MTSLDEKRFVTSAAGVRSPRILYGTAWKKDRTQALVELAIAHGFRGIDTAGQPKHYDEAAVGRAVTASLANGLAREDLYLQTKFTPLAGHDPARVPYDSAAALDEQVAQSFETSLRNLDTSYVDCLILHSPVPDPRQLAAVWGAMEAIAGSGRARQLGISNCYSVEYLEMLCGAATVGPAVVQNRFYAATGYDSELRRSCKAQGIVYQSFWTLTANPELLACEEIAQAARRHGRTPAQVLFRFLTQEGAVPLTGTQSEVHMREDLAIFEFSLAADERGAINALIARSAAG